MNDKNSVIEKIKTSAKAEAAQILEAAEKEAADILRSAERQAASAQKFGEDRAIAASAEILKSRETVAGLDGKKLMLGAKAAVLSGVYENAVKSLLEDKKAYAKLMESLLKEAADGDTVIVCERDKKLITDEFLKNSKKKLTLSKTCGDFLGGMILEGKNADKNLTLELILEEVRAETEAQIAAELFEGLK